MLRVVPGSPAHRAVIRPTQTTFGGSVLLGDVIQSIDGVLLETFDELTELVDGHAIGDTVAVTLWRNGGAIEIPATLAGP